MIMSIVNSFPFFEPDQVLTNKHLNQLFNYLDEQNRLTRCKLLGSGIVCGLEISHTPDTINITKGCGLTSQGYIILFCDHIGENGYKYIVPFVRPPFPNDLELISQCGPDPSTANIPFYAMQAGRAFAAAAGSGIFLLLTQQEFDAIDNKNGIIPLSQAPGLDQYAVVLFLDVNELNLKNCDTNDCNDKGSMMEFTVKPLLVNKKLLGTGGRPDGTGEVGFRHIELRRYNVPVKNINSSDDLLNAFVALLDDSTLDRLALDLKVCFDSYKSLLTGISSNPFGNLAALKHNMQFILQFRPIYIQYYYDFIYDLIHALYEFRHRALAITSECCGDEMQFPFHLTLGEASVNTNANAVMAYRQYFIYSPLFDRQDERTGELRSLLMRMILMYQEFLLSEKLFKLNRQGLPEEIKVTPSQYGHHFLSERCIPYYYDPVTNGNANIPGDLYYYWNFSKTRRGAARMNLSYNAPEYSTTDTVLHPLVYDIEWHNFFRVEGHIGLNINTALGRVKSIQQNYNLPFDVVALSADYIGALLRGEDPECIIQDLESDYRVLIAEFICRLHDAYCYISKMSFAAPARNLAADLFTTKAKATKATAATKEAEAILPTFATEATLAVDHPFIAGLVGEFQAAPAYTRGDTLNRLCAPPVNTIGRFYISTIIRNNGKFGNPIPANASTGSAPLQRHFFEFVDSVESMLQILMTQSLADLDTTQFKQANDRFVNEIHAINAAVLLLLRNLEASRKTDDMVLDYLMDLFVDNVQLLLHTCILEKLEALRNEYTRRLAQYRLAKNFNYYFKRHGGIEHKAGVPRGGTFVLVYHEERGRRFIDANSVFLNRDLSNVMLTRFKELLKPEVKMETQEANLKLLTLATQYSDPALFLRLKDVMKRYLDDCKDIPPDRKTVITGIIDQPPAPRQFQLANGMVIADFYVPYICCSDCPPIAYIINEPASVSIGKKEYCGDDKTEYPIEVSPDGGVIKIDTKKLSEAILVPAAYTPGVHTITYTVNNKSVTTSFEIVAPPKIKRFTHKPIQVNQNLVEFLLVADMRPGALLTWDYGDGQTKQTNEMTHEYAPTQSPQTFKVTLTIVDGPCTVKGSDEVTLTSEVIP